MKKSFIISLVLTLLILPISVFADSSAYVSIECPESTKYNPETKIQTCYLYISSTDEFSEFSANISSDNTDKYSVTVTDIVGDQTNSYESGKITVKNSTNFALNDGEIEYKVGNATEKVNSLKVATIKVSLNEGKEETNGDIININLSSIKIGSLEVSDGTYATIRIYVTESEEKVVTEKTVKNPDTGIISISSALIVGIIVAGSYMIFKKNTISE